MMSTRKILVVGGKGLIGAAAALHLDGLGHQATFAAIHRSCQTTFIRGSCLTNKLDRAALRDFDTLVFAAENDLRQLPPGADERRYFHEVNALGIPAFFERARDAGIDRAIYVGSYYLDVVSPEKVEASPYLASQRGADQAVRALASADFMVCTLQSPFTIGFVDGVGAGQLEAIAGYCLRLTKPVGPRYAPTGGSNFMWTRSFAQGVAGAIARGEAGRSYLMGDENWTYAEYFGAFLESWAATSGRPRSMRPIR